MFSHKRPMILVLENYFRIFTDVCTLLPTSKTIIWPSWYQKATSLMRWRDFLLTVKADTKNGMRLQKKESFQLRGQCLRYRKGVTFFSFVTQLLWTYCSSFLVFKAAGCCPRKQEKPIYLAHGPKEQLLFPYARYGIKVLLSTSFNRSLFHLWFLLLPRWTSASVAHDRASDSKCFRSHKS